MSSNPNQPEYDRIRGKLGNQNAMMSDVLDKLGTAQRSLQTVSCRLDDMAHGLDNAKSRMARALALIDQVENSPVPEFLDFAIGQIREELLDRPRSPYATHYKRLLGQAVSLRQSLN